MNDKPKITLSPAELAKVKDTEWILTKHRIIATVYRLFEMQEHAIKKFIEPADYLPDINIALLRPRIYKGENYLQFPYVLLDYPAVFGKEDVFALRTMFWWGQFFSITLLLSGKYKSRYAATVANGLMKNCEGIFICVNKNPWYHYFGNDNYIPVTPQAIMDVAKKDFIKIAVKYPLDDWNEMPVLLATGYKKIFSLISDK